MHTNKQMISSLTPLRGIAAIWVVIFHFEEYLSFWGFDHLVNRDTYTIIGKGYLLVDFFFILSGFVIYHVYGQTLNTGSNHNRKNYLWARFIRLYPLHLFIMLALLLQFLYLTYSHAEYAKLWAPWYPTSDFFVYLLFGQSSSILTNYSWNLPSWSIAAEWWTYILAILFIPILSRGFSKQALLVYTLAGLCLTTLFLHNGGNLDFTIQMGALRCLCSFIFGIGIYQIYIKLRDTNSNASSDLTFIFATACLLFTISTDQPDLLIIPVFSLLILVAALNKGKVAAVLNTKPFLTLGNISYSVYLSQLFWLNIWAIWLDLVYLPAHPNAVPDLSLKLIWLSACIVAIVLSSYATYHYIEIPAQRKLKKVFQ